MTASWLIQMGWQDVYVVENALESGPLNKGDPPAEVLGLAQIRPDFITPHELEHEIATGRATVIDFETSLRYRDAHIPGAWLAIRANLAANLETVPPAKLLVLTSADGIIAQLAAPEAVQCTNIPVKVLQGGTAAWRTAGLPLENGLTRLADKTEDVWYRPYDRTANVEEAMQDYLIWEVNLAKQIERDDDVEFRTFTR
jgi:rhodanese-related sulfurtransferase